MDFDDPSFPAALPEVDAVVCFETIEHLKTPFAFLERLGTVLPAGGQLLLSFPNEKYERLNPDGTNRDPYHLHILSLSDVHQTLFQLGYQICSILGQPICNNACSRHHDLRESGLLKDETVWRAFRYDIDSLCALARILAYPQEHLIDESYSYLIVARKIR